MKLSPDLSRNAALVNSAKSPPSPKKEKEAVSSRSLCRCLRLRRHQELHRLRRQRRRVRIMCGGVCLIPVVTLLPRASDLTSSTNLTPSDLPLFMTGCTVGKQGASIVKLLKSHRSSGECKYRILSFVDRHVLSFVCDYLKLLSCVLWFSAVGSNTMNGEYDMRYNYINV